MGDSDATFSSRSAGTEFQGRHGHFHGMLALALRGRYILQEGHGPAREFPQWAGSSHENRVAKYTGSKVAQGSYTLPIPANARPSWTKISSYSICLEGESFRAALLLSR